MAVATITSPADLKARRSSGSAGFWLTLALPLAAAVAAAATAGWPRWGLMWAVAVAVYADCKWVSWRRTSHGPASGRRQLGYLLAWPGMDAAAFLDRRRRPAEPTGREWTTAAIRLAVGLAVLFGLARLVPPDRPYLLGWIGMVGLILCLHFGSFALLSCAWRTFGVDARPLMNRPLTSVRLADFWGLRWNTAFRDLTHRFLFRPLTRRLGGQGAVWVGFAASGIVHDAVISLPAGGGYGGPTLFFLIQAAGMTAERSRVGRRFGLGRGGRGWLFTMAVLVVPVRLLFHRPFVVGVVVPFLHAIGAVP